MNTHTDKATSTILCTTLGLLLLAGVAPSQAEELALLDNQDTWQNNRLFEPTASQLKQEEHGRIMIYDGLKDTIVDKAMNAQFDRIQNMMFTRVIRTAEDGQPAKDENGSVVVEDDGC